jgi:hypothetical protein
VLALGELAGVAELNGPEDCVGLGVVDGPGEPVAVGPGVGDPPGVAPGLGLGVGEPVAAAGGRSFINSRLSLLGVLLLCA